MKNVTYTIMLKDRQGEGASVIPDHFVRVFRKKGEGNKTIAETLIHDQALHPGGDLVGFEFAVPRLPAASEWTYFLELFGPADPGLSPKRNYHTELVLPRRLGGAIDFLMPPLSSPDFYAGDNEGSGDGPAKRVLEAEDFVGQGPAPDTRSDFGAPLLMDARTVAVHVTTLKGQHVRGYQAQLSIHSWGWWSKRRPLDHGNVGYVFQLRRTEGVIWVHLYKAGSPVIVTSARIWLGPRDAHVVFVLPAG